MFDSITSHALHSENMPRRPPPPFSPTISRRAQSAGSLLNDNAASEATRSDWIDKNNLFEQSRVGGTMPTTTYLSNRSRQKWRKKLPIEISNSTNTTRNSTPLRKAHAHLIHFMSDGDVSGDYVGTPLLSTQALHRLSEHRECLCKTTSETAWADFETLSFGELFSAD